MMGKAECSCPRKPWKKRVPGRMLSIWMIGVWLIFAATGCDAPVENASAPVSTTSSSFLAFTDSTGQEIVLPQKPERIVFLAPEMLGLFYQLGGKAVGIATTPGIPVPDGAKAAENVGQIVNVSMEKITSLKPDLVIGQEFFHADLRKAFAANQIPFALLKMQSYEDFQQTGRLFGQIIGKPTVAEQALKDTDSRVQAIISRLPHTSPTYAGMTIMPMGVYIQKKDSMTVDIAQRLKLHNVADEMASGDMPGYVPYSLEKLIEADPDFLFIVVHGTEEFGKQKLAEDMAKNPAWSSLRAVKEKRMHFLPSAFEKTLGLEIDQAFAHMAKLAYPEVYGNDK
ncbi:ABC transporter substrate-binding protein [Brevibacillus migulae]|uniref:ABC transporter substrate-binding protein n=1 Tax=Brevibacillus migulae TaxID=1644114 RepID=UPI00106ECFD1|nr:ABC transporter substrate-binding protein [Brevibacillus migulae]